MAEHPLVVFLTHEGRAERLLTEHVADESRHCRVCSTGPQGGRQTRPCSLAVSAAAAVERSAGSAPYLLSVRLRERRRSRAVAGLAPGASS